TGVKSLGCEKRMAHPLPIQSWKLIFPWVVSAVKLGASLFIRSAMFLLRRSSTRCGRVLIGARGRASGGHEPEDNPDVLFPTHEPENLRGNSGNLPYVRIDDEAGRSASSHSGTGSPFLRRNSGLKSFDW